jgi:uncharacterized protein
VPADLDHPPEQTRMRTDLSSRLGRVHARQRLVIEAAHESRIRGLGYEMLHADHWYSTHGLIRLGLRVSGLYGRARRNAADVQVRHNDIVSPRLPPALDGFTLLQISDLHTELSEPAISRVAELIPTLTYDLTVFTGDYRARTFGPHQRAVDGVARLLTQLRGPVYGVLGNHDTIRMVPAFEAMGMVTLLNESTIIEQGGARFHLAGVDDPHFFRTDNVQKAGDAIPEDAFSVLLSHTPLVYRQAAHAGFDVMLCGHTHGGQLCLPGGFALSKDRRLPRRLVAGPWWFRGMAGYTSTGAGCSMVAVRLNCPAEITLHHLRRGAA